MKKIRVQDAVGQAICHDITEINDNFKGVAFKRGHVVRPEDVERLLDIGKSSIFVWEEAAGAIHEEDAALRLAALSKPEGAVYSGPSEGKMVLKAECDGLFHVDTELLYALNMIEDITVTTLPDHFPVKAGDRLAAMRIVPLCTKEANIEKAEAISEGRELFSLYPYKMKKAGVIITGSEVYTGRKKDKFEPVVREKLAEYPCEILGVTLCGDDIERIDKTARGFLEKGADILIFCGGMSVDPDDVTPAAIAALGADIVTHGMPAQPGNMTLLGYLGDVSVIGVPSAAIKMHRTVFDVMLPALFAGVKLTRAQIMNIGHGGLCRQCAECHFPNCTFGRY